MRPLTLKELEARIGDAVYIENLTIESYPRKTYPGIVFDWRFTDPFSAVCDMNERVQELTVVQPAAWAMHTAYWKASDYGTTWLAYTKPMYLWREP